VARNKIKKSRKFKNFRKGAQKLPPKSINSNQLGSEDVILLQKCFYKKDNATLKKDQLESRIRIAQLEAQNAMQSVQKEIDESSKEYDALLSKICIKYGIDLAVDKVNLAGLITRATPSQAVEESPAEDKEEVLEDEEYPEEEEEEESTND